jgi:hypothetical protein
MQMQIIVLRNMPRPQLRFTGIFILICICYCPQTHFIVLLNVLRLHIIVLCNVPGLRIIVADTIYCI